MTRPAEIVQSQSGDKYVAVTQKYAISPGDEALLRDIFRARFLKRMLENRARRDGPLHHITIISPGEFANLSDVRDMGSLSLPRFDFDLGTVSVIHTMARTVIFTPAESPDANEFRSQLGLGPRDFHITLGFLPSDIHSVRKSQTSLLSELRHRLD